MGSVPDKTKLQRPQSLPPYEAQMTRQEFSSMNQEDGLPEKTTLVP